MISFLQNLKERRFSREMADLKRKAQADAQFERAENAEAAISLALEMGKGGTRFLSQWRDGDEGARARVTAWRRFQDASLRPEPELSPRDMEKRRNLPIQYGTKCTCRPRPAAPFNHDLDCPGWRPVDYGPHL